MNTKLHYLVAVSKQVSPFTYSMYLDEELIAMGYCQELHEGKENPKKGC